MSIEKFAEEVCDTCNTENYGSITGIMAIIEVIMELIQGCQENRNTFVQSAANPTRLQQVGLRIHVRRTMGVRGRKNVKRAAQAMIDKAATMDEAALGAIHDEGVAAMNPAVDYDFG